MSLDDLSTVQELFGSLGLGDIDADEDGCFVLAYDAQTTLYCQALPPGDVLKVAVSVSVLASGDDRDRSLHYVLRSNLEAVFAETPGVLSLVPTTGEILWVTFLPLFVAAGDERLRPLEAVDFRAMLECVLAGALSWQCRMAQGPGTALAGPFPSDCLV